MLKPRHMYEIAVISIDTGIYSTMLASSPASSSTASRILVQHRCMHGGAPLRRAPACNLQSSSSFLGGELRACGPIAVLSLRLVSS